MEALGKPAMPWQQHWALVTGEMVRGEEVGLEGPLAGIWVPAYPEDFATVPRQSGKTETLFARAIHRGTLWRSWDSGDKPRPQQIAWSAQSGADARKKFQKELVPSMKASPLSPLIKRQRLAAENAGLDFVTGSALTIWASSKEAGHGSTVDMAILDEVFADEDNRREQATVPAMATRHDRQKLLASTAPGPGEGVFFRRKLAAARKAVDSGEPYGTALADFGAEPDDDFEDPALWRRVHPAIGHTITVRTLQTALAEMRQDEELDDPLVEFSRAWLNVVHGKVGSRVVPEDVWLARLTPTVAPPSSGVVAVDASPDGVSASIAVVSPDALVQMDGGLHRAGTAWAPDAAANVSKLLGGAPVVMAASGPAGHLTAAIREAGCDVVLFTERDENQAAAAFLERVMDGRIRVREEQCRHCERLVLSDAVEGAARKVSGDGWRWARRSSDADISPLVAATYAAGHVLDGIEGKLLPGDKPKAAPMFAFI